MLLSGCLGFAPEPAPVQGAVGVTVDAQGRPVLVVETCTSAPGWVFLTWSREGLEDNQQNEQIGTYEAQGLSAGTNELVLHDPGSGWDGEPFELEPGPLSVLVDGQTVDGETVAMTQFSADDLAGMEPGTVYRVTGTSEDGEAVTEGVPAARFAAEVCTGSRDG